jgi:hypothetical protein
MYAANHYGIRRATAADATALERLAALDSQSALSDPILLAEVDGTPVAAISLADGRAIADPFRRTAHVVGALRTRAHGLWAYERTPSLRARLLDRVRPTHGAPVGGATA